MENKTITKRFAIWRFKDVPGAHVPKKLAKEIDNNGFTDIS
ncbi:hypothetical protein [Cellulophaga fucicola]|uniref:Uncharacterized protein n=1 Tax=Cellulophaga fucicola TaxID=76595 RepID=A0A1K1QDA9_9FLAO|nr:hypothetical protein [Cellulophaga fucicola]SFW57700.1 hypothetical protein SAMN05660313_02608 [Cellulophaga fucicola]